MDNEIFKILYDDPHLGLRLLEERFGEQLKTFVVHKFPYDMDLAQEVIQLTLIVVYQKHQEVASANDPFRYIMGIARRIGNKIRSAQQKHTGEPIEEEHQISNGEEADLDLLVKELMDEIFSKGELLTPRESEVLRSSALEGLDNEALEKRFNLKPQSVKNLMSKVKQKCVNFLRGDCR